MRVLVELRVPRNRALKRAEKLPRFAADPRFEPIPIGPDDKGAVVRGTIEQNDIAELERQPDVVKVWSDSPVAPFM